MYQALYRKWRPQTFDPVSYTHLMFLEVSGNISEGGFRFSVHFKHQPNMVGGYGVGNHFLCTDTLYLGLLLF